MVFCSLIASSAIRAFISAPKLRRCLDFISARFPRQRFYTLMSGPNFGEHFKVLQPKSVIRKSASEVKLTIEVIDEEISHCNSMLRPYSAPTPKANFLTEGNTITHSAFSK